MGKNRSPTLRGRAAAIGSRTQYTELEKAKQREVVQLLRDLRTFETPLGGAASTDAELNLQAKGSYGPAGLIFAGTEFEDADRKLLAASLGLLRDGLTLLRREATIGKHDNGDVISGRSAYNTFIEPYLGDPADAAVVDDWRRKAASGYRSAQRFLERHDLGVAWLASNEPLRSAGLHVIFPKVMSESEEAKIEHQYVEMYAVYQRLRVSGLTAGAAMGQAAEYFGVPVGVIDRVIEFRAEAKPDTCMWGGCERAPFSQNLCQRHYQQKRRAKNKGGFV